MSLDQVKPVLDILELFASPCGFEFHPFLVGWYNDTVQEKFRLDYPQDALAVCIVSKPCFFEKTFVPYLTSRGDDIQPDKDPLDQCIAAKFSEIRTSLSEYAVDVIHDFELHDNVRRPKVLVQTAGHVSGAAFYYQKSHVVDQPWGEKRVYGVSIHPTYGGWFGFRGTLLFRDLVVPSLTRVEPVDILKNEEKITLLENFNYHWRNWAYRDIIPVAEKYSELQKRYFEMKPSERGEIIKEIQGL